MAYYSDNNNQDRQDRQDQYQDHQEKKEANFLCSSEDMVDVADKIQFFLQCAQFWYSSRLEQESM